MHPNCQPAADEVHTNDRADVRTDDRRMPSGVGCDYTSGQELRRPCMKPSPLASETTAKVRSRSEKLAKGLTEVPPSFQSCTARCFFAPREQHTIVTERL